MADDEIEELRKRIDRLVADPEHAGSNPPTPSKAR
jgi:hypothetical protein